jgi:hypothetical protein
MYVMDKLENQFRNLILDNIPKNLDLALPLNKDHELQTVLAQILELLKDTNYRIQTLESKLFRLKKDLQKDINIYGG